MPKDYFLGYCPPIRLGIASYNLMTKSVMDRIGISRTAFLSDFCEGIRVATCPCIPDSIFPRGILVSERAISVWTILS